MFLLSNLQFTEQSGTFSVLDKMGKMREYLQLLDDDDEPVQSLKVHCMIISNGYAILVSKGVIVPVCSITVLVKMVYFHYSDKQSIRICFFFY